MRARRLSLAILCGVLGVFAVIAGSAQAAFTHQYLSQVTGFETPTAVAVGGSGEVYVADAVTKTVDRFSSAGVPLPFSASGAYIEGSELAGIPTGPPEELSAFAAPTGVAVDDESGDVYVADGLANVVDVFSSTGTYLSQLTGFSYPNGLAVDQTSHNLYVVELPVLGVNPTGGYDGLASVVNVISHKGELLSRSGILAEHPTSVGVNNLNENIYAAYDGNDKVLLNNSLGRLTEWNGKGTPEASFGYTPGVFPYEGGLAVTLDSATQQVYVAQSRDAVVDQFAASASEEYEGQLTGTPSGHFNPTSSPPFWEAQRQQGLCPLLSAPLTRTYTCWTEKHLTFLARTSTCSVRICNRRRL